jgi:hypothetical protein
VDIQIIPNANMFQAKDLTNKTFEIEEIAAGSYTQNRQQRNQEIYGKNLATRCLFLVLYDVPLVCA